MAHIWHTSPPHGYVNLQWIDNRFFWALVLTLLMLLPEWLFSRLYSGYIPYWEAKTLLVIYLFNILIIRSKYLRVSLLLGCYLYFLQLSEFMHYRYFGSFYGPTNVVLLFSDFNEIISSLGGVFQYMLLPLLVVGVALTIFVFVCKLIYPRIRHSRISFVFCILLLLVPVINVGFLHDKPKKYDSNPTNFAVWNGVYAVSYFIGVELPKRIHGDYTVKKYSPYSTDALPRPGKYHVVLVMGESLSSTHMSLYGYKRKTTPFIDGLKKDGKLIYRQGIAAAISTRVSIPMFMNVQYEPDNWLHIPRKESSLFDLAKQAGFQTAFLSSQMLDGISSLLSSSAIDYWRDQRNKGGNQYDDCLIEFMQQINLDWSTPVFAVLNQRSAHSPYQDDFPNDFARFSKQKSNDYARVAIDRYDDAVRYIDHNLKQILSYLQSTSPLPVILIFTSDHGELVGERGQFGHRSLDLLTARVPFLFYAINAPTEIMKWANDLPPLVPHYEIASFTARLLGYGIQNPNQQIGEYYLNGTDLMGRAGYMSYHLSDLPEYQQHAKFQRDLTSLN